MDYKEYFKKKSYLLFFRNYSSWIIIKRIKKESLGLSCKFLKLYNILEEVINKIGIMGIVLANVALSFVTKTISKGYKSTQLKKEKEKLEEKIKNFKQIIEEPINEANKSR